MNRRMERFDTTTKHFWSFGDVGNIPILGNSVGITGY